MSGLSMHISLLSTTTSANCLTVLYTHNYIRLHINELSSIQIHIASKCQHPNITARATLSTTTITATTATTNNPKMARKVS